MGPNYDGHVSRSGHEKQGICIMHLCNRVLSTRFWVSGHREKFSYIASNQYCLSWSCHMFACSHPTSLSLIYHLAMYFCTWQEMVYVSLHSQSRALDVECDVSKLCWYFVFLCRSALTQSYFRFTSFMKTKISIYPRIPSRVILIDWKVQIHTSIILFNNTKHESII